MSQENGGMVDVHAEVIGSEVKRSWIKTAWAWRKSICLFIIGLFLIAVANDILHSPSKTEKAVTSVAKSVDQAIAVVKGPDLDAIHRDNYEYAAAVRNGNETEIRSWWRSMFWSDKKIEDMALGTAIEALNNRKAGTEPAVSGEIEKVQEALRVERGQLRFKNKAEAAVKK